VLQARLLGGSASSRLEEDVDHLPYRALARAGEPSSVANRYSQWLMLRASDVSTDPTGRTNWRRAPVLPSDDAES
jgi:hypothetical protein